MANPEKLSSPRLTTLRAALDEGDGTALKTFWREVSQQQGPLIEPFEGDDNYSLVTFLWQATNDVERVDILSTFAESDSGSDEMVRLSETNLWYKTYRVRNDARESYQFAVNDTHLTDPFNPHTHTWPDDEENQFKGWTSSLIELPNALPQPWLEPDPTSSAGEVTLHRFRSDILDGERRVWIYTPPDYEPDGPPCDFLLLFDGWFYLHMLHGPAIFDYLIARKLLSSLVVVMVGSVWDETREQDLVFNPSYLPFLTQELVPWTQQTYSITQDPKRAVIGGASLGGFAAMYAGLHLPEIFGNVLAQSASLWRKPDDESEYEWLAREYASRSKLPRKFHFDIGLFETATPSGDRPSQLVSNRHMRNVLRARGCTVNYTEFYGGHNPVNWPCTLADGLVALLGQQ